MKTQFILPTIFGSILFLGPIDLSAQDKPPENSLTPTLENRSESMQVTAPAVVIPPNTIEISNDGTNAKSELGEDHLYLGPKYIPLIIYPYTSYYGSNLTANRFTIGGVNSSLNVDLGANPYYGSLNFGHIAVDDDQGIEKGHLTVNNLAGGNYGIIELWGENGLSNITLSCRDGIADFGRMVVHDSLGSNAAEMTVGNNKAGLILTLQNGVRRTESYADAEGGYMKFYSNHGTEALLSFDNTGDFKTTIISDRRFKDNIRLMTGILPKILQLEPSYYNYKNSHPGTPSFGLIAQNVQSVFPELVSPMKESPYLGVNYTKLGVLNIQAIKEQQVIIDELQQTQEQLLERIKILEEIIRKIHPEN